MAMRFANKWLVLVIDLITIGISFYLAYFIRFNLTLNFDVSKLVQQMPMVILIGLTVFLVTGSYNGVLGHTGDRDVYSIFKAISLWSVLIILLVIINRQWQIYPEFSIPLSIILICGLLSFVGLTACHFVFKFVFNFIFDKTSND